MRYFFDTEFIEDGRTIDLISIGIVAEDGRKYYAINYDCALDNASQWVRDNVLTHLSAEPTLIELADNPRSEWKTYEVIRQQVLQFCDVFKYGKPEFWGYYAAYDWVVFCQLFGTLMQLPYGFPKYCQDLKQYSDYLGDGPLPPQLNEHHALADAEWNAHVYQFLLGYDRQVFRRSVYIRQ